MPSGDAIRRRSATAARLAPQLGGLLTAARERAGKSRRELADEAGVAPATLAGVERGDANPTLAYLERLADLYGADLALVDHAADGMPTA